MVIVNNVKTKINELKCLHTIHVYITFYLFFYLAEKKKSKSSKKAKEKPKITKKTLKKQQKAERMKKFNKSKYLEVLEEELDADKKRAKDRSSECDEDAEMIALEEDSEEKQASLDSEDEQNRLDNEEFRSGQKLKKKRRTTNNNNDDDEGSVFDQFQKMLEENMNNAGPVITPVRDEDRLLPRGIFSDKENNKEKDYTNSLDQEKPEEETDEEGNIDEQDSLDLSEEHKGPLYKYSYELTCGYLSNIWDKIMSLSLTEDQYKRCLVFIPENVMAHLKEPVKLTDFFINSYNCGEAGLQM